MDFDSHILDVLDITVALVNTITCTDVTGTPYTPPTGAALRSQLAEILVRGAHRPTIREADVELLTRLAGEARAIFAAVDDQDIDRASEHANQLLAWTDPRPRLDKHGDQWNVHFHGPDNSLGKGWAAGCAAGITLAIGSRDAGRLGICAAPACDQVYIDRSKNQSKRFCSLACQSRVKAAAHRHRQNTATHGRQ
ncbi:MAG TPA: CGNR zinc finger domain-containing protein [Microlunatus sp.]